MGILDFWKTAEDKGTAAPTGGTNNETVQQSNNSNVSPSAQDRAAAGGSQQIATGLQNAKDNPADAPFADLWQLDEEQKKRVEKQQLEIFGQDVTPEKIFEAARQIDFTRNVPQELMEKVLAGDQAAFIQLVNGVGQSAYAQSSITAKTASETTARKLQDEFESRLPELIRTHQQRNDVSEDNKLATNPATKPMFDLLLTQMQSKYPGATTAQLKEHTSSYLKQFITSAGGTLPKEMEEENKNPNRIPAVIKEGDDWGGFFQ